MIVDRMEKIDLVAIFATIGVAVFILYGLYLYYSPHSHPTQSTLTTQINLNSDGGILILNMTFSNGSYGMASFNQVSTWYSSYKINSAIEELPNGTIITPATSYVQKQIQIDCITDIYLGNSTYYSCR